MFEKIVRRRSEGGPALTIGELAEALLFYQNVHLWLDHGSLESIVRKIGMPILLAILARPNVSAVYCEQTLGTQTERISEVSQRHRFVAFKLAGHQDIGEFRSRKDRLTFILERMGVVRGQARLQAQKFLERVPVRSLEGDTLMPGGVISAASEDMMDSAYVHEAVRRILGIASPERVSRAFRFEVITDPPYYFINTDIDFSDVNARRRAQDPNLHPLTEAHLLTEILVARAELSIAARYGGELYTSELTAEIIKLRFAELLQRAGLETQERREFREIAVPDVPSIREIINKGGRTFDEFLQLLDKSQRFREWIQTVNPDEKLVEAYFRDVTAQGWLQSLPARMIRYVLTSGISAAAPITGLLLSAADSLLLEKVTAGWRPSIFVQRKLRPFLDVEG